MVIGNNAFGDLRGDLRGSGLFFIHCNTRNMGEKMSDLVKRLRMDIEPSEGDMEAAADFIEAQAARIAELEAALRQIIGTLDDPTGGQHVADMRAASSIAIAALEGRRDDPAA